MKEVLAKTHKQIILIQDGAPYHKGTKVAEFLAQNKHRLTIYIFNRITANKALPLYLSSDNDSFFQFY